MFSQSTRPAAVSLAVLTNWFANFLVGLCYPLIQVNFLINYIITSSL